MKEKYRASDSQLKATNALLDLRHGGWPEDEEGRDMMGQDDQLQRGVPSPLTAAEMTKGQRGIPCLLRAAEMTSRQRGVTLSSESCRDDQCAERSYSVC